MAARIKRESDIEVDYLSNSDGHNENLVDVGEEMDDQHRLEDGASIFTIFRIFLRPRVTATKNLRGFMMTGYRMASPL